MWPTCTSGCFARAHRVKLIPEVVVSCPCKKRIFNFCSLHTLSTSRVPCTSIAAFAILCTCAARVDTTWTQRGHVILGRHECNSRLQSRRTEMKPVGILPGKVFRFGRVFNDGRTVIRVSMSPRYGASSGGGWRNGLQCGG